MKDNELLIEQPKLGRAGMIVVISIMNAIAPLSTDMYMPALPGMSDYFHTSAAVMNFTMVGFFFLFAIGMLLFGPISDKYGRKRVLIAGIAIYILASIGCASALNVTFLIISRTIQALGAGCMVSVSTAIIKDAFAGKIQATVLATTQIFGVLAPILSPIIGAWILRFFIWRVTFIVLAVITTILLILIFLMKETLPKEKRLESSVSHSFSRLGAVMKPRRFRLFLISTSMCNIPVMSYIATSSFIYEKGFGIPTTNYSYFFAATALISVAGPLIYVKIRNLDPFKTIFTTLGILAASGALSLLFGNFSPFTFVACFSPAMVIDALIRPFSTDILINMQRGDSGSASAMINFCNSIVGTFGMVIITAIWTNYITGIGILLLIFAVVSFLLCLVLRKLEGAGCLDRPY